MGIRPRSVRMKRSLVPAPLQDPAHPLWSDCKAVQEWLKAESLEPARVEYLDSPRALFDDAGDKWASLRQFNWHERRALGMHTAGGARVRARIEYNLRRA